MATEMFRLGGDFLPEDVVMWYHRSAVGDDVLIALPGRTCVLRLIACPNKFIYWWPEGGRGVSMPLENTVCRLVMLQNGVAMPPVWPRNRSNAGH
jgi:hypothetical protein